MTCRFHRTYSSVFSILGASLAWSLSPGAGAAVLHDQRGPVVAGTWNGIHDAYIGAFTRNGTSFGDSQGADDFMLSSPSRLTTITVDFLSANNPIIPIYDPAGGFLIEVFPDIGGKPSETPTFVTTSALFTDLGPFTTGSLGALPEQLATYSIDVSGANIEVGPGMWWLSVTAVDESPFGLWYRQAAERNPAALFGSVAHRRQGGADHGNGYSIGDWTANAGAGSTPRALSFSIEGNVIPAPAAAGLLTLWALAGTRRSRRS